MSGSKKTSPLEALRSKVQNAGSKCAMEWLKKNMPASGTTASVSMSVSMSMSASVSSSPSLSESIMKISKGLENEKKRIDLGQQVGIGKIALGSVRLFRGTIAALCLDPDAVNADIYDGGVKVNQADITTLKDLVKAALLTLVDANKRGADYLNYSQTVSKKLYACPEAEKLITDFKAAIGPCKDETECT